MRRLLGHPWLLPLTALLLRARTVRPSAAFALRELARLRGAYRYRLAGGGLQLVVRHGTPDVVTLGEVFHDRDYVPDADIAHMLSDAHTIVDLGANIGLFGAFAAARWPEAEILAFEPDPANLEVHRRTIAANGLQDRWKLIGAAAGSHDEDVSFIDGEVSLSRVAAAGDDGTITVAVHDVLPLIGEADLLKMDIEGGEWPIIGDPRFRSRPPRVVVMEYHPYRCPTDDPRAAATAALRDAGMTVQPITHHETGHGMLWAWRT